MTADTLLLFALTYAAAAATPGPATTAVVARVLVEGPRRAPAFGLGLLIGDLMLLLASVALLMAFAATLQPLLRVVQYAGAAYLLRLAWTFWYAPSRALMQAPRQGQGPVLASGLVLALGNPKTMLFYLALLPAVIRLGELRPVDVLGLVAVVLPVFALVFGGYVWLAARVRSFFVSPRAVRGVYRVSAVLMAGAAVAVVLR